MSNANAPQVPPPDRPETMTFDELREYVSHHWTCPTTDGTPRIIEEEQAACTCKFFDILSTYAALEAVKAENARLTEVECTLNDLLLKAYANNGSVCQQRDALAAQLAEAQKDSARMDALESWNLLFGTEKLTRTAIDAARSGRKETDNG